MKLNVALSTNTTLHSVVVKRPPGTPKVATELTNYHGHAVMAGRSSCHATTQPNIDMRAALDLDQFHQKLKINHDFAWQESEPQPVLKILRSTGEVA
ncbi:MAG: hypothetical protein JNN07_12720 [Verrucomicrobiales bacterium]|nr:hypothetical protein [Verrucomicrobiales bacterium]